MEESQELTQSVTVVEEEGSSMGMLVVIIVVVVIVVAIVIAVIIMKKKGINPCSKCKCKCRRGGDSASTVGNMDDKIHGSKDFKGKKVIM